MVLCDSNRLTVYNIYHARLQRNILSSEVHALAFPEHVVAQTEHIQAPWMIELRKEASNSPWIRISAPLGVLSSMLII
jgi:hypothetical protein